MICGVFGYTKNLLLYYHILLLLLLLMMMIWEKCWNITEIKHTYASQYWLPSWISSILYKLNHQKHELVLPICRNGLNQIAYIIVIVQLWKPWGEDRIQHCLIAEWLLEPEWWGIYLQSANSSKGIALIYEFQTDIIDLWKLWVPMVDVRIILLVSDNIDNT